MTPLRKMWGGFGAIAAIVILVILASLAAAITIFGTAQQLGSAQDVLSARAWAAARTGNEWGLFQALRSGGSWTACSSASQTLDLSATAGFWVTVTCDSKPYNEGESTPGTPKVVRVYRIESTACNNATCPGNAAVSTSLGYIERKRQVIATN